MLVSDVENIIRVQFLIFYVESYQKDGNDFRDPVKPFKLPTSKIQINNHVKQGKNKNILVRRYL